MAGSEGNLISLLCTLESKAVDRDDKIEAYTTICKHLKDEELSLFGLDVTKNAKRILAVIRRDITTEWDSVIQGALQVLGFLLHDPDIARNITDPEGKSIIGELCQCVKKTIDKTTCTRALWCLNKQCLPSNTVAQEVHSILVAVEHALDHWRMQSITVEHEAVNTISRLQEQVSPELKEHTVRWGKLVYPLLVHTAVKIRERALVVMETGLSDFNDHQETMAQFLIADFKSKMAGELTKLFNSKNEVYVLTVWSLIVQLMGKELHHGSFINQILPVAELGFKSASVPVKCAAFQAWKHLIDNFAQNPAILGDVKRVKLIMQVFKINNAKVEEVALKKLEVWWHFVQKLGPKVSVYFDQVCVLLLQMCVGSSKLSGNVAQNITTPTFSRMGMLSTGTSPVTPRLNLTNPGTQLTTFSSVQLKGCEILAHFLGQIPADLDVPKVIYSVGPLPCEVMPGPAFFINQSPIILSCAKELISSQGKQMQVGLLYQIWYSLVAHVKNAIESGAKSESRDVLTTFLNHFQLLVLTDALDNSNILKMFQAVCCLPRKALCSTAYQMGGGEVLHGTPILFLTELLLTPKLMGACVADEKYMSLFGMLVEIGLSNYTSVLEFCQVILQVLGRHSEFVESSDQLWRMWSIVVTPLLEHIRKTNEVNQGDVLEHDFTCMYTALLFPVKKLLMGNLSQPTTKTLLKTWFELYGTFARLSAMVTNAEANISCEDLSQRIRSAIELKNIKELSYVEALVQMLDAVIGKVDFSSVGAPRSFTAVPLSPSRWTKRKQRPMENIHTFVLLLADLMDCLQELTRDVDKTSGLLMGKQKTNLNSTVQSIASCIVGILTVLFTHVTSSHIIGNMINNLAAPTAELFKAASNKSGLTYPGTFQQKLEKFWLDLVTCLQSRYTGGFDSDFLYQLSPLLEVTFLHTRRQIKTQTVLLWNATFSKSPSLLYPENLRPVLVRVKEKTPLSLPGWISAEVPVIEETPISQFSQIGSSAPEPRVPGMPSPHKIHGSFLNKAVSPDVRKSPARAPASKPERKPASASKAKKNLSLSDMRDDDFVIIAPSPTKKRPLTEHQKDVMKQRRSLPAMYNNLELSQDVSMASQFMTDTQTEKQSQSDSVVILDILTEKDKKNSLLKSQTDCKSLEKSDGADGKPLDKFEKPDQSFLPKRRRSIRFSDEVQEESNTIPPGQGEKVMAAIKETSTNDQASETMNNGEPVKDAPSFMDFTADESANDSETFFDCSSEVRECGQKTVDFSAAVSCDVGDKDNSDDLSTLDKTPSCSSQQSEPSLKQNLLHAMGGFVSDISSSSGKSAFSSVDSEGIIPDASSGEITPQKIPARAPKSRRSASTSHDGETKDCPLRRSFSLDTMINARTSPDQQGTDPKEKCETGFELETDNTHPVSLESIVEDTQDVISPTKSPMTSPTTSACDFESVMETPVKSADERSPGLGETRTPTSRALFECEHGISGCPSSPSQDETKKSPIVKLRRLTTSDILNYSPHRDRPFDKDDLVRTSSQPHHLSPQAERAAKVRRSLSQPEDGKFGGKLLRSETVELEAANLAPGSAEKLPSGDVGVSPRPVQDNTDQTMSSTDAINSSGIPLDSQLSEGFVPEQTDQSQSLLGNIDMSQVLIEDEEEGDSNMMGPASLTRWNLRNGQDSGCSNSQDSITSSIENLDSNKQMLEPYMYVPDPVSTLRNSTDLFSELSPTSVSESEGTPHCEDENSSPALSGPAESYDPNIASTLATSAEVKSRRKQQAPKRSPDMPKDRRRSRASKTSEKEAEGKSNDPSPKKVDAKKAEVTPSRRRGRPKASQSADPGHESGAVDDSPNKEAPKQTRRSHFGSVHDESANSRETVVRKRGRPPKCRANPDVKCTADDARAVDVTTGEKITEADSVDDASTCTGDSSAVGARTRKSAVLTKTLQDGSKRKADKISNTDDMLLDGVGLSGTVCDSMEDSENEKRGKKRRRESHVKPIMEKLQEELPATKDDSGPDKDGTVYFAFSDEEEVTFRSKEDVHLQAGGRAVRIVRTTEGRVDVKDTESSQDMTPDTRESCTPRDPIRQSTSQVKKEQAQKNSLKLHENAPKARKSLTPDVDPISIDCTGYMPLISDNAMIDSDKTDDIPLIHLIGSKKSNDSDATKLGGGGNESNNTKDALTDGLIEEVTGSGSADPTDSVQEVMTPSRKPAKYKIAKTSPMTSRLRSGQKTVQSGGSLDPTDSSAKKPKRLSLGRKKLDLGADKVGAFQETEQVNNETNKEDVVDVKEDSSKEPEVVQPSQTDNTKENAPLLAKESQSEEGKSNTFTEIREPTQGVVKVSFQEPGCNTENINTNSSVSGGIAVLETPKSSERSKPKLLVGKHSDSKLLHGPKRLSYPLAERGTCKTGPRGILKHSPLGKVGFSSGPGRRPFKSAGSPRSLHARRFHPVTVNCLYSPSASPSASILKRRRLSGDVASNSPSPPAKHRRVSFAEPISMAEEAPMSPSRTSQVNRCLTLPVQTLQSAPPSTTSATPKAVPSQTTLASQSQASCLSTQESQLNCTDPVYPDLKQCKTPVEDVLAQLTSSTWSRGLGQLVRAKNIRTVGDLSNLSEYQVHNLPIRSPKVPTLRHVLKNFEAQQEKRKKKGITGGMVSGGTVGPVTKGINKMDVLAEDIQESFTPPGSPKKASQQTQPSSTGNSAEGNGPNTESSLILECTADSNTVAMEKDVVAMTSGSVVMEEEEEEVVLFNAPDSRGEETTEDEVLPAMEDALSELSPEKGQLNMNASIELGTDDESDDPIGGLPSAASTNQSMDTRPTDRSEKGSCSSGNCDSTGEITPTDFLDAIKTLEALRVRYTNSEMEQLPFRDVVQFQSHLMALLNSTTIALGAKYS